MTPTETPHPLAAEAAKRASLELRPTGSYEERPKLAQIIHTTALEPVINAGEEMAKMLLAAEKLHSSRCGWTKAHRKGRKIAECEASCDCGKRAWDQAKSQALTQWRTLTSPKTGDSTPLAGSRSDFEGQKSHGQQGGGL